MSDSEYEKTAWTELTTSPTVRVLKFDGSNIEPSDIIDCLLAFEVATKKSFTLRNFHEYFHFEELIRQKYRHVRSSFQYSYNDEHHILSIEDHFRLNTTGVCTPF
ncbi:unnamed protein product [Caenorhabditis angaria]|uniref:Uncharacterized protein n=1 Tax=Caenorhabditis angaria TaxID=860376 RepID=A0A9P1I9U7_9PELO|nr:unnamed protein product [Caenorhabditis angaria]